MEDYDLVDYKYNPCPNCDAEMRLDFTENEMGAMTKCHATCPQCGYDEEVYPPKK